MPVVCDRKKTRPHPEVVDVHQQQQENSLASIHLPRDVSTDMRSDDLKDAGHLTGTNDNFLSVQAAESPDSHQDQQGRSPQRSPQRSPGRSPLPSPQRAAANALNMLSQISARTAPKTLAFLKPNIKVNLSSFNPIRQLKRQGPEDADAQAGPAETQVIEAPTPGEHDRVQMRRKSADMNMSQAEEDWNVNHVGEAERNEGGRETGAHEDGEPCAREAGPKSKVMVRLKKDWQEINLDSCGILATSPTHLLVSSFKWDKTVRRSLDLDFDLDETSQLPGEDVAKSCPLAVSTGQDSKSGAESKTRDKSPVQEEESLDVFAEDGKQAEKEASGEPKRGVLMRHPARRLRRSSSVEDMSICLGEASDEDSYCVLEEEEVKAILHKSQQLHHPHMKTSVSDNALMLQQQQLAGEVGQDITSASNPDTSPFSRFKMKMSTLAVPKTSSTRNQGALNISKSHIRKSQRAMEVFERLVREKLRGAECQSRIIFI